MGFAFGLAWDGIRGGFFFWGGVSFCWRCLRGFFGGFFFLLGVFYCWDLEGVGVVGFVELGPAGGRGEMGKRVRGGRERGGGNCCQGCNRV